MAAEWFVSGCGQIHEDGEDEWFVPGCGQINEDQAVVAGANPKGPLGMPLHGPLGGPI